MTPSHRADRPNLLLLMADQMRDDVVDPVGAAPCRTPHLAILAAEGVRFTQTYTACPLCSPARASLFTGRYPHSHGLLANTQYPQTPTPRLPADEPLVSRYLAAAGYRCGYTGKWHLGVGDERAEGLSRGFADFADGGDYARYLADAGIDPALAGGAARRTMYGVDAPMCGTSPLPAAATRDAYVADQAIALLHQYRDAGLGTAARPFALVCSFAAPHFPLEVPTPYDRLYRPDDVPLPASFHDAFHGKPQGQRRHPWLQLAAHLSPAGWQELIAHYWGYVGYVDALCGRVLAALDALGLRDRTAVCFLADHGEMAGHHRMFDKGPYLYEDVMRIPCLWRWPRRFPAGRSLSDGFASLVDVAPTLCALVGADATGPRPVQGRSLLPWLLGATAPLPAQAFAETNAGDVINPQLTTRMVREGRWKYVYRPGDDTELYDLAEDPDELVNLAPASVPERRRLEALLEEWMAATRDPQLAEIQSRARLGRAET